MHPAMTYYDYYLISNHIQISCVNKVTENVQKDKKALVAYNSTSTKLVMVI